MLPSLIPVLIAAPTSIILLRRPLRRPSVKTLSETETGSFNFMALLSRRALLNKPRKLKPRSIVTNWPRAVTQLWASLLNPISRLRFDVKKRQKLHFPLKTFADNFIGSALLIFSKMFYLYISTNVLHYYMYLKIL